MGGVITGGGIEGDNGCMNYIVNECTLTPTECGSLGCSQCVVRWSMVKVGGAAVIARVGSVYIQHVRVGQNVSVFNNQSCKSSPMLKLSSSFFFF